MPSFLENMSSIVENSLSTDSNNGKRDLSRYISLCSSLLKEALEESRVEMDAITVAALTPGERASADLISRLQSVDRLMQRLTNVQSNLVNLADYVLREADSEGEMSWSLLCDQTRQRFTMEQERNMFDNLLGDSSMNTPLVSPSLTFFSDEDS